MVSWNSYFSGATLNKTSYFEKLQMVGKNDKCKFYSHFVVEGFGILVEPIYLKQCGALHTMISLNMNTQMNRDKRLGTVLLVVKAHEYDI